MLAELKELFATWIAAVAAAVEAVMDRLASRRRVVLQEIDGDSFTARLGSVAKGAGLRPVSFRLTPHGRPEPPLSPQWRAALRSSVVEVQMRPDQVLFREVDFPKQAADFLDGMVRAQIDRLTPWAAGEAVYGLSPPQPGPHDRIVLMLAATARAKIQPLVDLAAGLGAASISGVVTVPADETAGTTIRLFNTRLAQAGRLAISIPRLLRGLLIGGGVAAAASFAVSAYLGARLDTELQDVQQRLNQRRAALRLNQGTSSAELLLTQRKRSSASSVMVLEALSRALPDSTYTTELRIEGDKMQVVGLTQDAPSLIRLLEQSPQFTRATFFAPTTRAAEDPGERFHIEAHITPYFGSGS
ncbi:Fimbrial assembly precursor [Bradyrhizobium sp. STM 3843]|uniref:PilN domain-containing protein n=1 Tax=Bradyrhizobium sp. STM 3843 TaxID=551947 RepID=UPI0002407146|nr:PilN domain-containing protein [Bradyrhizobium sp. STM 3843]CCE06484.1 Fimbrial assembly precursor [Bradyrhizobium sp. STM 3843]